MRGILAFLLIWAILATGIVVYAIKENQKLEDKVKELELEIKVYNRSEENILRKNKELWDTISKYSNSGVKSISSTEL
ncbi:MAG: hypothetical protein PWQ22_588 [Archaeoglobaceae archaeon]|nr:hypothetical protein [Archaeoglobaceae archaeon]